MDSTSNYTSLQPLLFDFNEYSRLLSLEKVKATLKRLAIALTFTNKAVAFNYANVLATYHPA